MSLISGAIFRASSILNIVGFPGGTFPSRPEDPGLVRTDRGFTLHMNQCSLSTWLYPAFIHVVCSSMVSDTTTVQFCHMFKISNQIPLYRVKWKQGHGDGSWDLPETTVTCVITVAESLPTTHKRFSVSLGQLCPLLSSYPRFVGVPILPNLHGNYTDLQTGIRFHTL